jgi:isoaspartyl peptidase/L-asparaginase-like protein (Ntn-hydrolase superfamily)
VKARLVIAIHGGAGPVNREKMTPKRTALYRAGLLRALDAGYEVLRSDGSSVDAVTAAVMALEDSGLFNAGKGAVPNAQGLHELDAAIMDGATLEAGAVAAVEGIRNPVLAALAVMQTTEHVMLAGDGAARLASEQGLPFVPRNYFVRKKAKTSHGTVGAVALDSGGNLAAATSTGGMSGKLPGRVGDSPIIGAGTYAENATCAVSGTGHGESFIRALVAGDVAARIRYAREPLARAAAAALRKVAALGGDGGLIAVDARGRIAMPFNTQGMYRACIAPGARPRVAIF